MFTNNQPIHIIENENLWVPTIFHQTWKTKNLPTQFVYWSNTFKEKHPQWRHIVWDDHDNRNLIHTHYPWFLETYDRYDKMIKRVDAVRYFYLYHYGGVYVDMDFACLKNIEPLLERGKALFGYQLKDRSSIANAFMAAPPRHPLFHFIIHSLQDSASKKNVLESTGPKFLTNCIQKYRKYRNDVTVIDMPIIYSHEWDENVNGLERCKKDVQYCRTLFPESYMTTFWTATWWKENENKYK